MATLFLLIYVCALVPAQEIRSSIQQAKIHMDYYLDQADKSQDKDEWNALASKGIEKAIEQWENLNIRLKEQNIDKWSKEREDAILYYEL